MCKRCLPLTKALKEAKDYISLEGTNRNRVPKNDVLKTIRRCLTPAIQAEVDEHDRLKKLEEMVWELYNEFSKEMYWNYWKLLYKKSSLSYDAQESIMNAFQETFDRMERIFRYLKK